MAAHLTATMARTPTSLNRSSRSRASLSLKTRCIDTPQAVEDGPVHRPLIRATLPRLEGHKETRQATDFTIRQSNGRGANFQGNRGGDQRGRPRTGSGHGQGQGQPSNRPPGGGSRFAGARSGNQGRGAAGRPQGGGFRAGQGQRRGPGGGGGGGRKRSR